MHVFWLENFYKSFKYGFFDKIIRHRFIGCWSHQRLITYTHEFGINRRIESEHGSFYLIQNDSIWVIYHRDSANLRRIVLQ